MTNRTSVELTKLLLVACDQSYFNADHSVSQGDALAPLHDKSSTDPAYDNSSIYSSAPAFNDWQSSGYKIYDTIERPEIGAKLVIYQNVATKEVIVAFGGTDGIDGQDWVANTQSVGWNQWAALKDPLKGNLFGKLDTLKNQLGGEINGIHFTGQSLGGALCRRRSMRRRGSDRGREY